MKTLSLSLILMGLSLSAAAAEGFDAARFIQEKCSSCHTDSVYTRPNRFVHDRAQLEAQVRRCDANLGTTLFDDDLTTVVDYLDKQYYHFSK